VPDSGPDDFDIPDQTENPPDDPTADPDAVPDEADDLDDEAGSGSHSGAPRLIVLDAGAVIRGSETLFDLWQQEPTGAVLSLVNVLSWAMAHQGAEFVMVIEPAARADDQEIETAGLRQHSPEPGQTVSEAIMALAECAVAEGRRVTVVSSDVDVIRFAVEEKIQAGLADLFAASLLGGSAAGENDEFVKPRGLSAKESAEWDAFVVRWKGRKG
jgi:hypothetical protein